MQLKWNKKTWFPATGLVLLLLLGLLLVGKDASAPSVEERENTEVDVECFRLQASEQLEQLLADVEGVGRVQVMITVASTPAKVYAVDSQSSFQQNGSDSNGTNQLQTVFSQEDGKEKMPILLYQEMPKIGGVAVVCEGADDPRVALKVTQLICGLFGIGSNRVSVTN